MASDNLVLRSGTWHVRLTIPADARPALNRREFTASLKTGSKTEAQKRKAPYLSQWSDLIATARNGGKIDVEDLRLRAKQLTEHLDTLYTSLVMGSVTTGMLEYKPENTQAQQALDDHLWLEDNEDAERILRHFEVGREADPLELSKDMQNLVSGNLSRHFDRMRLKPSDKADIAGILKDPKSYQAKSPITASRLTTFESYQTKTKGIIQKTVDMQVKRLNLIKEWLEKNQKELIHDSISEYLTTLKIADKTKKQVLFAGSSFWKWAIRHDESFKKIHSKEQSPFEMHEFAAQRGKKNPTTERRVFSPEDVQKLHAEALSQDRQTLADLIALGAYTGARIEELCRLKKSDVISEEGIQCFSIYDSKTEASTRLIPVHESLKNIVDRLIAESDDDYLIKSPAGNKYGNRSDALSKQFGRLKTGLSYNGQYVFHSLRKTVITQLQRADVPGILIASIVGHETGTVTFDVYSAGPSPKQKLSAISNLSYTLKCGESQT